ncbi:hypothetical protein ACP70R_047104 [Stipagrostis hirtigluma subsp. patula]
MEPQIRRVSYKFLKKITNKFDKKNEIGRGTYGIVYKGTMPNGQEVAVKKLHDKSTVLDDEQLKIEFQNLLMVRHENIIKIVGYCYDKEKVYPELNGIRIEAVRIHRALCFEYLPLGSLEEHLSDDLTELDWDTSYKVIKGICAGLEHIHQKSFYHLDIKPGNILVDKKRGGILADFGLAKVFFDELTRKTSSDYGTRGYRPPEFETGHSRSTKFDIFSLGVVILQLVTGHKGYLDIARRKDSGAIAKAQENWRDRLSREEYEEKLLEACCEQVEECIKIGMKCIMENTKDRPEIGVIMHQLTETENKVQRAKEAMTFDLLPTLHPRSKHWTICVRVSRMWEYRGGTDDGPIQHLDLVLVDSEGNAMYAEVPASEVESKQPLLQERGVYVMSHFRVSNAKSFYRPVDMCHMIEFTCYTKIVPVREVPSGFPTMVYNLVPLPKLTGYRDNNRKFLDAIGVVTRVSESALIQLPNQPGPTQCRDVVIRDISNFEMKVTLWGHRAVQFDIDAIRARDGRTPLVVLFVGALMKAFQGEEYLSGNAACRWYFNPVVPEAEEFYTMLHGQQIEIVRLPAPSQQPHQPPVRPAQIKHRQLGDLKDIHPYDFPPNGYRCTATIVRLVPGASWWFPSCNKCSKACVPDGSGYRCSVCNCTGFKFKYKLCFIASDGSAEVEMIAFGDIARRIIGKPVQVVLGVSRYSDDVPPDVAAVVSLRFTFAINVTKQSYYRSYKSYVINSIGTAYGRQPALPRLIGSGQASSSASSSMSQGRLEGSIQTQLPAVPTPQSKAPLVQQEMEMTSGASGVLEAVDARRRLIIDSPLPDEGSILEPDSVLEEAADDCTHVTVTDPVSAEATKAGVGMKTKTKISVFRSFSRFSRVVALNENVSGNRKNGNESSRKIRK